MLGLGLNESAYLAEIFRAGLKSVDNGQMEAAEALGMRKSKIMWRIILPQAMRVIVPPTGNETIGMLKTTSLVLGGALHPGSDVRDQHAWPTAPTCPSRC